MIDRILKLFGRAPAREDKSLAAIDELQTDIDQSVRKILATGFFAEHEIKNAVAAMYLDGCDDSRILQFIDASFAEAVQSRQEAMNSWPSVTDCDRLDAAFDELNTIGIMARHNGRHCDGCTIGDLYNDYDASQKAPQIVPFTGYTFYHEGESRRAVFSDSLLLSYGTFTRSVNESDNRSFTIHIGHQVCDVLRKHNLNAKWNGRISSRIEVAFCWQRRQPPAKHFYRDVVGADTRSHQHL